MGALAIIVGVPTAYMLLLLIAPTFRGPGGRRKK